MDSKYQPQQTLELQRPEPTINSNSPEITEGGSTFEAKDYISVSDLMGEIETPAKPSADTVVDEAGNITQQPTPTPAEPEKTISREEAKGKIQVFMQFRDFVQSRAFALAAGDVNKASEYAMQKWEYEMLCEAYQTQVQLIGRIPDWMYIAVTEALILGRRGVMLYQAYKLKKQVIQQKKIIDELRIKNEALRMQHSATEQSSPSPSGTIPLRPDFKKYWAIEVVEGIPYFQNDPVHGRYVAKDKRERVEINKANYPFLVKHNGQELIDSVYNDI